MDITKSDALVVVDVQNDFCPGGALAVADGDGVVPIINRLAPLFDHHVYSRDWHPSDHCGFSATPEFVDGSWPTHCVADTVGAAYHPELTVPENAIEVLKATAPERDAYSVFDGTSLKDRLKEVGVPRLFVCGLATDYCVKETALDGLRAGFEVWLVEDAVRAVDNPPGTGAAAMAAMREAGVGAVQSKALAR